MDGFMNLVWLFQQNETRLSERGWVLSCVALPSGGFTWHGLFHYSVRGKWMGRLVFAIRFTLYEPVLDILVVL